MLAFLLYLASSILAIAGLQTRYRYACLISRLSFCLVAAGLFARGLEILARSSHVDASELFLVTAMCVRLSILQIPVICRAHHVTT